MTTPLDAELPPLPTESRVEEGYIAEQMHAYARAAIAADRAARQPAPPVDVSLSALREGLRELRQAAESAILQGGSGSE